MKTLFISDLHIFHPTTPTARILTFVNTVKLEHSDADVIILAGDQFHSIVPYDHPDLPMVQEAFMELAMFCKANDIEIYVLKGTPSHDGNQNASLVTQMQQIANVTYIDKLSVLNIKGFNFAFYPDPGVVEGRVILNELEHLRNKDIDVLVTHMSYNYNSVYEAVSEVDVVSLARYGLLSGHVHQHNIIDVDNKFVCSIGPYERLNHNTEDVGLVSLILNDIHAPIITLHKNKQAYLYTTVYQDEFDANVLRSIVGEGIIRFRVKCKPNSITIAEARLKYKRFKLIIEVIADDKESTLIVEDVTPLSEDNLISRLLLATGLDDDEDALRHLENIKESIKL